jgi:hypothetical protein
MNFLERRGGLNVIGSISLPKNTKCPTLKPTRRKRGTYFRLMDGFQTHHKTNISQHILGEVPSKTEIKKAISRMASNKAPGKSGLNMDMIKCLPPKAMSLYVEIIQEFWKKDNIDFDSWYITVLNLLYEERVDRIHRRISTWTSSWTSRGRHEWFS